ncbi:MAG: DUF3473 domain-containing protein [Candidatus Delongbacteria bacterium]|nr:DUF3473 domain-containing protein [Candidatus Delongbacteria bacterium]
MPNPEQRLTHAFSVDVEEWYHPLRFFQKTDGYGPSRLWLGLERLLALLDEHGTKGTFFWIADVAVACPEALRLVAEQGHEIACHSYSHEHMIYHQTPAEFKADTERAMKTLQDISGVEVRGFRAPCFSITARSLWAFDILGELGFDFDSSVFPVHNWRYGIPGFRETPNMVGDTHPLLEIPLSVRKVAGVNIPAGGGAYFRIYPYWLTAANFRHLEAKGQPAVFYIHTWELDPEHPRVRFDWRAMITHYVNLSRTEGRLRRLLSEFRFAPLGELVSRGVADAH